MLVTQETVLVAVVINKVNPVKQLTHAVAAAFNYPQFAKDAALIGLQTVDELG